MVTLPGVQATGGPVPEPILVPGVGWGALVRGMAPLVAGGGFGGQRAASSGDALLQHFLLALVLGCRDILRRGSVAGPLAPTVSPVMA